MAQGTSGSSVWVGARKSPPPQPTVSIKRLTVSDDDKRVRDWFKAECEKLGCTVEVDEVGNMFATRPGKRKDLAPIAMGSHLDTQPTGGKFDGVLGVLGALEAMRTLVDMGYETNAPVMIVNWTNEEGSRFAPAMLCSGVYAGVFTADFAYGREDRNGIKLGDELERIGYKGTVKAGDVRFQAMFELHIEQGGLLEKASRQIGVVEGIVGLRWFEITITGFSNHAGATPMDQRQDAMLAAAKFTVAVNDAIRSESGRQVATVGRLNVTPNTTNVIPGQVVLTVDLRDLDQSKIDRFTTRFEQIAREIGAATSTKFAFTQLVNSAPAISDSRILNVIESSATALGLSHQRMPSGAGHDAQEVAHIAPMAMIFVPSVGGISHSPKEFSRADDIANGANVLMNAVMAADGVLP